MDGLNSPSFVIRHSNFVIPLCQDGLYSGIRNGILEGCLRNEVQAGVAQLVEHHVANVVVVSSNLITRSLLNNR